MNVNEPIDTNNWKLGIFYYNTEDKRLFVPKRNPAFGLTLNFANPKSVLLLISLCILFVVIVKLV
jgi:uncharacterized membrane protein